MKSPSRTATAAKETSNSRSRIRLRTNPPTARSRSKSSESKDGDGKGGEYQDSNKVIDGDQYYGDRLEEYLALAEEILENDGEIPDDLREFIESYYGTIE